MTVNARSGVPTRSRLRRVVRADCDDVGLAFAEFEVAGQIVAEADVSVRTMAKMEAVNPDVAIGHDTIKLEEHSPPRIIFGQVKVLAIPADAVRQEATGPAGAIGFREWPLDAPVVRDIYRAPRRVVEGGLFRPLSVALQEPPTGIEWDCDALPVRGPANEEQRHAGHGPCRTTARANRNMRFAEGRVHSREFGSPWAEFKIKKTRTPLTPAPPST